MTWDDEAEREYNKLYLRFRRKIGKYLERIFEEYTELTIDELQDHLETQAKRDKRIGRPIRLKPRTLRKCIKEYKASHAIDVPKEIYKWER